MANSPSTPASCAIFNMVHASLKLLDFALNHLTIPQLLQVKDRLDESTAIVNTQIQSGSDEDHGVTVNLFHSETPKNENENTNENVQAINTQNKVPRQQQQRVVLQLLDTPDPYPMDPPPHLANPDEQPEGWYVVDYGKEVGIFTDKNSAELAIAGTRGGHYIKVDSWLHASVYYNVLHSQGDVIRVRQVAPE